MAVPRKQAASSVFENLLDIVMMTVTGCVTGARHQVRALALREETTGLVGVVLAVEAEDGGVDART